jgi:hypothetical protein
MFDDAGGSLTQNRIYVRLVQNNIYLNKPIRRSDLQLLLLPAGRHGPFNPEDLPASTLHHTAVPPAVSGTPDWSVPIAAVGEQPVRKPDAL